MNGLLVKVATVGLLLCGGVLIAAGQYDSGAVSDEEASSIRGAGCVIYEKDGGCTSAGGSGCGAYDDYDYKDGEGGTSKLTGSYSCGGSCGNYDQAGPCG